jgi:hypothetical protein
MTHTIKNKNHPDVLIMKNILRIARESLCPPTYDKFCDAYNELIETRRLPLRKL